MTVSATRGLGNLSAMLLHQLHILLSEVLPSRSQKASLFEAIFACKWMWKINQEVSVGRYPIEEAKISPMAWEQIYTADSIR